MMHLSEQQRRALAASIVELNAQLDGHMTTANDFLEQAEEEREGDLATLYARLSRCHASLAMGYRAEIATTLLSILALPDDADSFIQAVEGEGLDHA